MSAVQTHFEQLGGEDAVRRLANRFYDLMEQREPALTALHTLDADGRVSKESRERFGLFLIGWLGGPAHYMEKHGHPRLRMRHAPFPVTEPMRDAWVRCMHAAVEEQVGPGLFRDFLLQRFGEVASFLRNAPPTTP